MYIYPDNLKAKAMLWLWELRDVAVIAAALLLSVFALARTGSFTLLIGAVLYNSLREAVISYSIGLTDLQRQGKTFCAHRLESTEYQQRVGSDELYCKATWRFFMPECDDNRFAEKCEQLTQALNLSIGGMTF